MIQAHTEQPEALRLADAVDPLTRKESCDVRTMKIAADELRRLHARVQELEAQTAHMADLVEQANYAHQKMKEAHTRIAELEAELAALKAAPAAQPVARAPLSEEAIAEIAERFEATDPTDSFWIEVCRAFERASVVGITQVQA